MTTDALREPWTDIGRQREAAVFAIWLFLGTEVLFFGAMLAGYSVYRFLHPESFLAAGHETNIYYGSVNTFILILSSFVMAAGELGARHGFFRFARICFPVTAVLGMTFLILKGFEYNDDLEKHLFPGPGFPLPETGAAVFWGFYWVMTLIHAIHLTIGIGAVIRLQIVSRDDPQWLKDSPSAEVTALYWHFVDGIWVILFPIFYLAGRS
jgi:cytochrome c oxidase subunit III